MTCKSGELTTSATGTSRSHDVITSRSWGFVDAESDESCQPSASSTGGETDLTTEHNRSKVERPERHCLPIVPVFFVTAHLPSLTH